MWMLFAQDMKYALEGKTECVCILCVCVCVCVCVFVCVCVCVWERVTTQDSLAVFPSTLFPLFAISLPVLHKIDHYRWNNGEIVVKWDVADDNIQSEQTLEAQLLFACLSILDHKLWCYKLCSPNTSWQQVSMESRLTYRQSHVVLCFSLVFILVLSAVLSPEWVCSLNFSFS